MPHVCKIFKLCYPDVQTKNHVIPTVSTSISKPLPSRLTRAQRVGHGSQAHHKRAAVDRNAAHRHPRPQVPGREQPGGDCQYSDRRQKHGDGVQEQAASPGAVHKGHGPEDAGDHDDVSEAGGEDAGRLGPDAEGLLEEGAHPGFLEDGGREVQNGVDATELQPKGEGN